MVRIKGHEIKPVLVTSSYDRRALQYKNKIIATLRQIGLTEDDVEIPLERIAIKKTEASVTFWFNNDQLYYSYSRGLKFVDNLYMVLRLIEIEVSELLSGSKSKQDFCLVFSEDEDVVEQRKEARELLGVSSDCVDLDEINNKYKILAKNAHPDMPNGNHELFQKLNKAHKLLKRELS
jgi:hypothetical protein